MVDGTNGAPHRCYFVMTISRCATCVKHRVHVPPGSSATTITGASLWQPGALLSTASEVGILSVRVILYARLHVEII
jgi:hypothetical protein